MIERSGKDEHQQVAVGTPVTQRPRTDPSERNYRTGHLPHLPLQDVLSLRIANDYGDLFCVLIDADV